MRYKARAHSSHNNHRGLVDHLGPNPNMRSGGGHMTDLTISLKGLAVSLSSRVEYSVIYMEALTCGTPARVWRVTTYATTVARKATSGRTVPPLLGQRHALQFRLPTSINRGTKATDLRRRVESVL